MADAVYRRDTFEEPQVLISCRGAASGKINLSPPKCYITNNSLVLDIKRKDELDRSFLYYSLNVANKSKLITGTAQPQVTINNAVELEIPLPPLPEQQAIVAKIEELISELENGKQQLQTAQKQLKVYRQSLLKAAFDGKLTNKNIKDGELPKGWKWVKPEDISSDEKYSIGIGPFGSNLKVSDYKTSGVPLIFVKNITRKDFSLAPRFISKEKLKELYPHSAKPLDILITKMGDPPGDCAIYPESSAEAVITSDCLKLRVNEKLANRKFIFYAFQTQLIKRQFELITKGVAQKKISLQRFKSIKIPIPTLHEQQLIVSELESKLTVCDKIEETISQSLQRAETLRQSILKKAFEGKLIQNS
jgi:type I restriction enzyme, S subunit